MSAISGFGEGLKRLREDRALSQAALGKLAGVTQSHLSAYETGKRLPNVETLGRILDALGSDLLDLHNALARQTGASTAVRTADPPVPPEGSVPPAPETVLVDLMREEVRRLAAEAAVALGREGLAGGELDLGGREESIEAEVEAVASAGVAAGVEPDV